MRPERIIVSKQKENEKAGRPDVMCTIFGVNIASGNSCVCDSLENFHFKVNLSNSLSVIMMVVQITVATNHNKIKGQSVTLNTPVTSGPISRQEVDLSNSLCKVNCSAPRILLSKV